MSRSRILQLFFVLVVSQPVHAELAHLETVRYFERAIRPLLIEKCGACHGTDDPEAGLTLTTVEGLRQGGTSGHILVPGDSTGSRLIQVVRYTGKVKMPPAGKLDDRDLIELVNWVDRGAGLPVARVAESKPEAQENEAGSLFAEADRLHWSFQPIRDPELPPIADHSWPANGVDHFILAKLEAYGLNPQLRAERSRLVRRVTYDLVGLPPSPEEVEAFVTDSTPDAFAKLVDRLLASPHYGEKWGRHWLDVARYADTNGGGFDYVYPNAYHYRDYVVRALNADKPYDQFVMEQLAGDLMPVGHDLQGYVERLKATGFLTLAPKGLGHMDKEQMVMDVVDDQIDACGRTLMGLTLACARCHDHKFDPIPIEDYYSLAGIFRSTVSLQDLDKNPSYWPERPLEFPSTSKAREAYHAHKVRNEKALAEVQQKANSALISVARGRLPEYLFAAAQLYHMQRSQPPANDTELACEQAAVGELIPSMVKNFVKLLSAAESDPKSPLLRLTAALPQSLAEVTSHYSTPNEVLKNLLNDEEKTPFVVGSDAKRFYTEDVKQQLAKLNTEARTIEATRVPDPQLAMVAFDASEPQDLQVHVAGNRKNLGALAPRGFLRIISAPERSLPSDHSSGRLELARWLIHPDHPLTARVIANRIWQWHFGEGLVRTSDNFGRLGEQPSHSKLLDWLASRLLEGGWSLKALHRQILLSATYQQASHMNERSHAVDSGNHLLWKMNRRRMEAELIRDAMLTVSGQLDQMMFGTAQTWKAKEVSVNDANEERANYNMRRRTIHLPVVRHSVYPMLSLFDFGDPNSITPNRSVTTVASQALFMLNSPFVAEQSEHFARRLLADNSLDDAGRIQIAYQCCFSRMPTEPELERAMKLLTIQRSDGTGDEREQMRGWRLLCQGLFALNEFIFID